MPTLAIEQLKPLMILADEVRNRNGRLLATKGMVLSGDHVRVFKTWGIKEVNIVAQDDLTVEPASTLPDTDRNAADLRVEAAREELRTLFIPADLDHPFIRHLLDLAAEKKARGNAN